MDPAGVRALRGRIYQIQLRVDRLEGAWPDPATRNPAQRLAIADAHDRLEAAQRWAATLGVEPWASDPEYRIDVFRVPAHG